MFTADEFRAKAAESTESLKHTDVPSEIRALQRSEQSFSALAQVSFGSIAPLEM
jgi:hypothetical protein